MPFCCGYNDSDFFATLPQPVTVIRGSNYVYNAGTGNGTTVAANVNANTPTGYYTDKYRCNLSAGALPGTWKTPLVWESYCQLGVKREITLLELVATASMDPAYRNALCNSLEDKGGNPRKPKVCGGSDPDIYLYNANANAGAEIAGNISAIDVQANEEADKVISETRKKVFYVSVIILIFMAFAYLIFKG